MVTEAGKELLRNSINTANFHNKILEENEMWKHWEMEKGLTMMVSDDEIMKRVRKHHQCEKHRKLEKDSREKTRLQKFAASSSKDRWDHGGFCELYPDEGKVSETKNDLPCQTKSHQKSSEKESVKETKLSFKRSSKSNSDRWDHSGYQELYSNISKKHSSPISNLQNDKWDHNGYRELYPESDDVTKDSSNSKKKKKKKRRKVSKESTSDNEIYEDFKRYKKGQKEKQKISTEKLSSVPLDNHVKEWKKHHEKSM